MPSCSRLRPCIVAGAFNAAEIENRWRQVHIERHLGLHFACVHAARIAQHHGHSNRRLVHQALVEQPPLPEEVAVVGTEDDGSVVGKPMLVKPLKHSADVLVYGDEPSVVILAQLLE